MNEISETLTRNTTDPIFRHGSQGNGDCVDPLIKLTALLLPDIEVMYYHENLNAGKPLSISRDLPSVNLVFQVNASCRLYETGASGPLARLGPREHNLFVLPANRALQLQPEAGAELFIVRLPFESYSAMIPPGHALGALFDSRTKCPNEMISNPHNLPLRAAMQVLLLDILHSRKPDSYRVMSVRAKLLELLMLQLEQAEQAPVPNQLPARAEIQRMYQARELITSNLADHWSIIDLAKKVGTNDCYLKRQFKEVFGSTVYGYLHHERMKKAKQLLEDGDGKIADVAKSVGYKHASHFSLAFRKYFGYLPNKLRLFISILLCEPDLVLVSDWAAAL